MPNMTSRQQQVHTMIRDVVKHAEDVEEQPLASYKHITGCVHGHPGYSRYLRPVRIRRGRGKSRAPVTEDYVKHVCLLSLDSQVQPVGYVPGYGFSARPVLVREARDAILKQTTDGCDRHRANNIEQAGTLDRSLHRKLLKGLGTEEFNDLLREARAQARQLLPASSQRQLAAQLVTDAAVLTQPGSLAPAPAATVVSNGGTG